MISQGLTLMVAGMGTVLLFLSLMVIVMYGTAWFFKRFAHLFVEEEPEGSHLAMLAPDDTVDIAVAVAAIRRYIG
ncbi:MAG: OadG family protein [Kiritimatiellia bacterium]|nr:OadG family protein [Kiritimatiellia bacterium]MDP6847149.1 OadG family protein [Kiritimatiellia bacterium]